MIDLPELVLRWVTDVFHARRENSTTACGQQDGNASWTILDERRRSSTIIQNGRRSSTIVDDRRRSSTAVDDRRRSSTTVDDGR